MAPTQTAPGNALSRDPRAASRRPIFRFPSSATTTSITPAPKKAKPTRSIAASTAAWTRPKKSCWMPTCSPKARNISASVTSQSVPITGCWRIPPISKATRLYTIFVKDLATGELLPDRIANTYYSLEWANDNRTFFYTVLDPRKRPYRVLRHQLGAASDELVYRRARRRASRSASARRAAGGSCSSNWAAPLTSEVRYLEADQPLGEFRVMLPRQAGRRVRRIASRRLLLHPHQRQAPRISA